MDPTLIEQLVQANSGSAELRRLDSGVDLFHATYALQLASKEQLAPLMQALRQKYNNADLSFIEADNMLTA